MVALIWVLVGLYVCGVVLAVCGGVAQCIGPHEYPRQKYEGYVKILRAGLWPYDFPRFVLGDFRRSKAAS